MTEEKSPEAPAMTLPITVVSLIDLGRLLRELEAIEVFLSQATAREPGEQPNLPRTTHNLDALARANKLNLLMDADRQKLRDYLEMVRDKAPHIHISFASDPSAAFLQKIVSWFRTTVHPFAILQVGLQPTIAAGCIVRTNSKYFDLSLRRYFDSKRSLLTEKISEARMTVEAPPATTPPQPATGGEKEYGFVKPTITAEQPAAPAEQEVSGG